jgi:hypothetical protein
VVLGDAASLEPEGLRQLREKDEPDGEPDKKEPDEDPEQECRLTDGEPTQLVTVEEELRATGRVPVSVVLDHLAADGVCRFGGPPTLGVQIDDPATPLARTDVISPTKHKVSLPSSAGVLTAPLVRRSKHVGAERVVD